VSGFLRFRASLLLSLTIGPPLIAGALQKPAGKPAPKPSDTVPSPVSKHYPILILARGPDPAWSLRLGMKGPERLDRPNYPPIVLEPGEVVPEGSGTAWAYQATDPSTGANVTVKLVREPCNDTFSGTTYTFRVEVRHAQIGSLEGCGRSAPDEFPEFRKKNQLEPSEGSDTAERDKKTVLAPITHFEPPVAVAYLEPTGRVVVSRGESKKAVAAAGKELALSHDGRQLLYTRSDAKNGAPTSIVLFDVPTGHAEVMASNGSRRAFWSPDDSRIAYLKFDGTSGRIWVAPASHPERAEALSSPPVEQLHGWVNRTTLLATDRENAYWISEEKPLQNVPLKEIYGVEFQVDPSDTLRLNPLNSDLLLVSACPSRAPSRPAASSQNAGCSFFLFELRSKRRTVLGPPDVDASSAEWSRDGLQIFFTRAAPDKSARVTDRIFWDGTGERRYASGSALVVGK